MSKTWKTNLVQRGVLSVLVAGLVVASVATPVTQAQSLVNSVRCGTINTYAAATKAKLNVQTNAMHSAFKLNLQLMQGAWDLQAAGADAIRSTADSLFSAKITLLRDLTRKENKKEAFETYKSDILAGRTVRNTDVDAAQAKYREDMLATVRTHQADLTAAVTKLTGSINTALETAKKNCATFGSVAVLVSAIVASKTKLISEGFAADVKAINKAIEIKVTRFKEVTESNKTYLKLAVASTKTLTKALLRK